MKKKGDHIMCNSKLILGITTLITFGTLTFIVPSTSIASNTTSARTPSTWNKVSPNDTQQRDGNLNKTTENGGVFVSGAEYKPQRSKSTESKVREIHKKSGIKEDVIYDLFDRGFTNGQVKNIVIVKIISGEEIQDIADTYSDTNKDLDLLLNSYQISKSDFSSKKSEIFD